MLLPFNCEDIISKIESTLFNLGYMDLLSYQDTPVHRLDSRIKLIVTLCFLLTVISFDRYEISMLIPFIFYPIYIIASANLPVAYLFKKVLYVSPFALMIGIFNPFFDDKIIITVFGIGITGGWVSFFSIMLRFVLTVTTVLALIGCTGFNNICYAMNRLGAPKVFSIQLMFLYRYIFVLAEETARVVRARNLRSFNGKGKGVKIYGAIAGSLLIRTINRAQRIHYAMICRGFNGDIKIFKSNNPGVADIAFFIIWIFLFIVFRIFNVPELIGGSVLRLIQ